MRLLLLSRKALSSHRIGLPGMRITDHPARQVVARCRSIRRGNHIRLMVAGSEADGPVAGIPHRDPIFNRVATGYLKPSRAVVTPSSVCWAMQWKHLVPPAAGAVDLPVVPLPAGDRSVAHGLRGHVPAVAAAAGDFAR